MLPKFLYGTFRRYKEDTCTFVDWLVNAAKKCGYEPALQSSSQDSKQKLKGPANPENPRISVKELSVLARTVAESDIAQIPAVVIATARRAIALRRRCARWFSMSRKEATETANEKHSHFIIVLEQLCEVLETKSKGATSTLQPIQTNSQASGENHSSALLAGDNPFSALSLQETKELEESRSPSTEVSRIGIEEENDDKDNPFSLMLFNLFCMFEDLHNMRQFVSESLAEYLEGKIDLMNLAVVTDTTVQLAKELVDEVTLSCPQLQQDRYLQEYVYVTACHCRGEDCDSRPDAGIPYNSAMSDVAEWCYLPVLSLLMSFRDVLQPGQAPVAKKAHFGTYDSKARRERMTPSQRFSEDKVILLELLPEFALMARLEIELPVEDEITRGLVSFVKDERITVWLCFAVQLLLDVHHALRHTNDKPFSDLRLAAARIKKTIEEHWELSKTFACQAKVWPKEGESNIKEIHACLEAFVIEDALYQLKQRAFPKNILAVEDIQKHFVLKSHGVLAGLMMFNVTLRMQQVGSFLVNQWYSVPQMAYLYDLAQQTGIRELHWPDMDVFIAIHGEESIFIGGRPKTADESLKKLKLATGLSGPSDSARDSRSRNGIFGKVSGGKRKARQLEPNAAVVKIFHNRYLANGPSKISVDNVDKLFTEILAVDSKPDEVRFGASALQSLRNQWVGVKRLGALQLLAALKEGLYAEEPRLQYSYFGMHKRCIEILRQIESKEHHKFVQYFTSGYMPNDTMISNIVLLILTVAQGSAKAHQQLGLPTLGGSFQGRRIVISCEEVMKEYLRTHGDQNCRELKTFCKNKSLPNTRAVQVESKENWYFTNIGELIDP